MTFTEALATLLGDYSILQIYISSGVLVGIWLYIANNLSIKRGLSYTGFLVMVQLAQELARNHYLTQDGNPVTIVPIVLALLFTLLASISIWTVILINHVTKRQQGWLFMKAACYCKELGSKLERRATHRAYSSEVLEQFQALWDNE